MSLKSWFSCLDTYTYITVHVHVFSTCTVPSSWPRTTTGGCLHIQVHRILDGFSSDWNCTDPVLPSRTWINIHCYMLKHDMGIQSYIHSYLQLISCSEKQIFLCHILALTSRLSLNYSLKSSAPFPLRLTCSLLQLSAADTMISSSLKSTSESLFRQTAEEVWTFLVSHNYKTGKKRYGKLQTSSEWPKVNISLFSCLSA